MKKEPHTEQRAAQQVAGSKSRPGEPFSTSFFKKFTCCSTHLLLLLLLLSFQLLSLSRVCMFVSRQPVAIAVAVAVVGTAAAAAAACCLLTCCLPLGGCTKCQREINFC